MCDTLVTFDHANKRSFFAKNSDREPGELQFVYLSSNPKEEFFEYPYLEEKNEYIKTSFTTLKNIFDKYESNYVALLSRPIWMWGAEMGVNEYGLSIGNEAVFSKEKVKSDGLLGMDILRLALHNTKTAKEAVEFILEMIEEHGQGGDGGYKISLKYHNSFIIKDFNEAYVLETSNKNWAIKKVDESASISNCYTLTKDYNQLNQGNPNSIHFKDKFENKLITFFTKGNKRQQYSMNKLASKPQNLGTIKEILRTHIGSKDNAPSNGMGSICMHSGKWIKSETTSSMIVDYIKDKFIVWYTSSPHPCTSFYKPFDFQSKENIAYLKDINDAVDASKEATLISKHLSNNYSLFNKEIKGLRDSYEEMLEKLIYSERELIDFGKILQLDKEYSLKAKNVISNKS